MSKLEELIEETEKTYIEYVAATLKLEFSSEYIEVSCNEVGLEIKERIDHQDMPECNLETEPITIDHGTMQDLIFWYCDLVGAVVSFNPSKVAMEQESEGVNKPESNDSTILFK